MAGALVLLWPTANDRSLATKAVNFIADPRGSLPVQPPPIPLGLGDDADAVIAHDEQEAAYYDAYNGSAVTRFRMTMREWKIPFTPGTTRQILIAVAVLGLLLVWRLESSKGEDTADEEE